AESRQDRGRRTTPRRAAGTVSARAICVPGGALRNRPPAAIAANVITTEINTAISTVNRLRMLGLSADTAAPPAVLGPVVRLVVTGDRRRAAMVRDTGGHELAHVRAAIVVGGRDWLAPARPWAALPASRPARR